MLRAKTLVDPPGKGASAVAVPARPSAVSLSVPSPARTATASTPSSAAPRAMRVAWPRRDVSSTSSLWSAPSTRWTSTRRRAVTAVAVSLTISRRRMGPDRTRAYHPAVAGAASRQTDALSALTDEVVECRACPRLVEWRGSVAREKRAAFRDESYWGRPIPGFGDPAARVLIVGLAPAAHGGNRTGRIFTGDRSGDWLYGALHRSGFASRPDSVAPGDGMRLMDCFITATVKCAPPDNKPLPEEFLRCRPYLVEELKLFRH